MFNIMEYLFWTCASSGFDCPAPFKKILMAPLETNYIELVKWNLFDITFFYCQNTFTFKMPISYAKNYYKVDNYDLLNPGDF